MNKREEKRYAFNAELFMNLPKVLGTSIPAMAEAIGITKSKFNYWRRNKDVPVVWLMKICDEYLIPIGHFISVEGSPAELMRRKDYMQTDGKYIPAGFLANAFGDEVTTMSGNTINYVCEVFGIGQPTFYNNFRKKNAPTEFLTMSEWVMYCNAMKVYPMDYLISTSVKVPLLAGYARRQIDGKSKMQLLEQRCRELSSQNSKVTSQLQNQRERIKELEDEVERLKRLLYGE